MVRNFMMRKGVSSAYYREFFTSSGNWVCPPGVAKVSVLIISSGLKGTTATSYELKGTGAGGQGGFYHYLDDYPVIPGQVYPIVVGGTCKSVSVRESFGFNGLVPEMTCLCLSLIILSAVLVEKEAIRITPE